jgi:hypothetical protein
MLGGVVYLTLGSSDNSSDILFVPVFASSTCDAISLLNCWHPSVSDTHQCICHILLQFISSVLSSCHPHRAGSCSISDLDFYSGVPRSSLWLDVGYTDWRFLSLFSVCPAKRQKKDIHYATAAFLQTRSTWSITSCPTRSFFFLVFLVEFWWHSSLPSIKCQDSSLNKARTI